MYQRSSLRYAHTNGYTYVTFTENGEYMLTCGSDGDIRKWSGIDDDDPTSNCLGEFVIALVHAGERLLASTDRNILQAYTFPAMDPDGTLLRFTAPVTGICVRHPWMAASSEDMYIKLKKQDDADDKVIELCGHKGPVLALDICSARNVLASIAGDGQLKIWQLGEECKELKSITGLPKVNSFESAIFFGTPHFEPVSANLLVYANARELILLETENWEVQFTLSDEVHCKSEYTCCKFSSDGKYLAAGTRTGEISVFDVIHKVAIKCEAASTDCNAITSLSWHPKNNTELAYCDSTGQLGTIFQDGKNVEKSTNLEATEELELGGYQFEDDEAAEDVVTTTQITENEDDDDAVSIERLKRQIMGSYDKGSINGDVEENTRDSITQSELSHKAAYIKSYKPQEAFQPSATPSILEHRYLVWNHVGIVTAHSDNADGAIDVEFNDTSVHHALHIPNDCQHTMASLSNSVLALAAKDSSKLVCIALAAAGSKEWTITLPEVETIEAMTVTDKLVAVTTSMQYLRLYSVMGTQREIISLPGPVVCVAGHGERIVVCYHQAPTSAKQQHLGALLFQALPGMRMRAQQIPLNLLPERDISWLGFSDCGSPVFCDHMGLLQMYSLRSNCWYPICDTMWHSVGNNYFIISVSEREQTVAAVLCRGTSYPMTNPRPIIQELRMQVPVCDIDSEKSQLEDTLVRACTFDVAQSERVVKETVIKLFALACRNDFEARAKELIETIGSSDILMLAVKYASKLGRIHLSDRLSDLMPKIEEQQQPEIINDEPLPELVHVSSSSTTPIAKLAPKPMLLNSMRKQALKNFPGTSLRKSMLNDSEMVLNTSKTSSDFGDSENMEQTSETSSLEERKVINREKTFTRSPLNSVNPFAVKRKCSELDADDALAALEKLKYAKK